MNKENLYLGYIDNELSEVSEKELEALLASEGEQAKNELFEIKDIADTVKYGAMAVRDQERKIIALMAQAEKSDRKLRLRRRFVAAVCYSMVAVFAFVAGIAFVLTRQNNQVKNMEIVASAGNKTDICLPDGTKVILKSASVLQYDINGFGKSSREVTLNGEAYFDVAKMPDSKFIIRTQRQRVTVHGTSFNLQAYDDDNTNTITLLKGNVSLDLCDVKGNVIRTLDINPMEKCTWDILTGITTVTNVDSNEAGLAWGDNIFYFKDMSICEISDRLEHYYGIHITTLGLENETERFSGALSLGQSAIEVMRTLNYDRKFNILRIDDNHFSISKIETKK